MSSQEKATPLPVGNKKGHYRVLGSQDDRVTLGLFDIQSTFEAEGQEFRYVIDKENDMINIIGKIYSRVFP